MLYPTSTSSSERRVSEPSPDPDPTPQALRSAALAFSAFAGVALLAYAVPSLARVRPWVPGEGAPIVRLFDSKEAHALPSFAEAGSSSGPANAADGRLAKALAGGTSAGPHAG